MGEAGIKESKQTNEFFFVSNSTLSNISLIYNNNQSLKPKPKSSLGISF
jgi:hypothetical protein